MFFRGWFVARRGESGHGPAVWNASRPRSANRERLARSRYTADNQDRPAFDKQVGGQVPPTSVGWLTHCVDEEQAMTQS
ncbi:hypothetical protein AAFF_G00428900 [Aldrovandia affinis]|uniref:Uncharacterized protein n=1 Tax=Aldrovandia affinis TaxID=143900 RepID=A0AAD7S999_9TELE|nr:hypothetical protein AAFF_G00428900 [Aldrovandia affinis]